MTRNESRIAETFAALRARGELGIIPYLTIGYPERESVLELVPALVRGGACAIELGIPFSDPLADGVTIQRASHVALHNGVTVRYCLDTAARLREAGVDVPFVFMGYFNPLLQYGLERFVRACVEVGVDGVIVPDLPPIESDELHALCRAAGRDLIFMVAPTSTERHLREVAVRASGFLYCVSLTGVTGARDRLPEDLPEFLGRVRAVTDLPLALGFGISRPEHVAQARELVDAVVVGSALLDRIATADPGERAAAAEAFIAWLRTGTAATVGEGS
ncbi:tryptophan synthase subunit alpha [Thermomicrobium sp. 4228-Ro]|uniref:tryptophan synthase subunit alpha n=1 Tax=Thermomicrobium sp. 4228-Ro TaxID=2993937 RepID=UPI002248DA2E|nr:tryptophan synthase subunit alpha [Thermomicrobium sp. 4228-Ro]MCX2726735.1 tryptophan synthase subunit alpha [Thermomicrobium sp. 4228-Ro]